MSQKRMWQIRIITSLLLATLLFALHLLLKPSTFAGESQVLQVQQLGQSLKEASDGLEAIESPRSLAPQIVNGIQDYIQILGGVAPAINYDEYESPVPLRGWKPDSRRTDFNSVISDPQFLELYENSYVALQKAREFYTPYVDSFRVFKNIIEYEPRKDLANKTVEQQQLSLQLAGGGIERLLVSYNQLPKGLSTGLDKYGAAVDEIEQARKELLSSLQTGISDNERRENFIITVETFQQQFLQERTTHWEANSPKHIRELRALSEVIQPYIVALRNL